MSEDDCTFTWAELAVAFPEFVQWVIQTYCPMPDDTVKREDYEIYSTVYRSMQRVRGESK